MKTIAMPVGLLALAGTIVPPVLVALQMMQPEPMKNILLVSCFVWFITVPMWIKSE